MYVVVVPRLWTQTIETHRREVGDAILDATATLVAAHGLRAVTMSQIAEQAGIGRATLYKYFPDVETILVAWHERHVADQVARLKQLRSEASTPSQAIENVLSAYAIVIHGRSRHAGGPDVAALLHEPTRASAAGTQLGRFLADLLAEGARHRVVRHDLRPDELANYCLHALNAAADATSPAAVERLVEITIAAIGARGTPGVDQPDEPPPRRERRRSQRSS